jgi:hypothetical protein
LDLGPNAGAARRCAWTRATTTGASLEDLAQRQITAQIAKRGEPRADPGGLAGGWWSNTNSWLNNFGELRRCTERRRVCVQFFIALAAAIVTIRSLIRRAWFLYRRGHPTPRSPHPVIYWRTL